MADLFPTITFRRNQLFTWFSDLEEVSWIPPSPLSPRKIIVKRKSAENAMPLSHLRHRTAVRENAATLTNLDSRRSLKIDLDAFI